MKSAIVFIVALLAAPCLTVSAQTLSGTAAGQVVLADLSTPTYPPVARQANITGDETVLVTVKPDVTVESAVVESGHPMLVLRQAAMDSASQSRFQCHNCKEQMAYRLVYAFKIVQGANCCDARAVAPKVEHHPDGPAQSHVDIEAEQVCICDPAAVMTKKIRSPKCLYLWKCSSR
jgi:Gram-negative bacterial TonB protein C-terminal